MRTLLLKQLADCRMQNLSFEKFELLSLSSKCKANILHQGVDLVLLIFRTPNAHKYVSRYP